MRCWKFSGPLDRKGQGVAAQAAKRSEPLHFPSHRIKGWAAEELRGGQGWGSLWPGVGAWGSQPSPVRGERGPGAQRAGSSTPPAGVVTALSLGRQSAGGIAQSLALLNSAQQTPKGISFLSL